MGPYVVDHSNFNLFLLVENIQYLRNVYVIFNFYFVSQFFFLVTILVYLFVNNYTGALKKLKLFFLFSMSKSHTPLSHQFLNSAPVPPRGYQEDECYVALKVQFQLAKCFRFYCNNEFCLHSKMLVLFIFTFTCYNFILYRSQSIKTVR